MINVVIRYPWQRVVFLICRILWYSKNTVDYSLPFPLVLWRPGQTVVPDASQNWHINYQIFSGCRVIIIPILFAINSRSDCVRLFDVAVEDLWSNCFTSWGCCHQDSRQQAWPSHDWRAGCLPVEGTWYATLTSTLAFPTLPPAFPLIPADYTSPNPGIANIRLHLVQYPASIPFPMAGIMVISYLGGGGRGDSENHFDLVDPSLTNIICLFKRRNSHNEHYCSSITVSLSD